jgi:hypothetical protein
MTTADDDRLSLEEQLAAEPLDREDLALLSSLRAYYEEHDPVPNGLVERIQFELTLDALHAEVATLTQLDLAGAGTRSAAMESVRTITFTSESMTTMVTITPDSEGTVRIDGWAAPGADIRVQILLTGETRETYADADGRFVFEQVPPGLAKFALHPTDGESTTVVSPTMEL